MTLATAKQHLAASTRRGQPMIMAGLVFWACAELAYWLLPARLVPLAYLFGTGMILPLGLLIAAVQKIDLFTKGNPLGALGGLVGAMQILFAPILVLVWKEQPDWLPFAVGALTGAHFLPFVWIYDSKTYLFQSIATVLAATVAGIFFMDEAYFLTPLAVFGVYLFTYAGLQGENERSSIANFQI